MSDKNREFKDLVAIYGAVDAAVQSVPERAKRVSELLPVYENPEGVHWFEAFERETANQIAEQGGSAERAVPTLEEALEELGQITPWGRMRARRMFAIAVAGRAFPEMSNP